MEYTHQWSFTEFCQIMAEIMDESMNSMIATQNEMIRNDHFVTPDNYQVNKIETNKYKGDKNSSGMFMF